MKHYKDSFKSFQSVGLEDLAVNQVFIDGFLFLIVSYTTQTKTVESQCCYIYFLYSGSVFSVTKGFLAPYLLCILVFLALFLLYFE